METCLLGCTPSGEPLAASGTDGGRDADAEVGAPVSHFVLRNGRLPGGMLADVEVREGKTVAVGDGADRWEARSFIGRFLAPAFIHSHVALALLTMIPEALGSWFDCAFTLHADQCFYV